jgi:hypothetical protein
MTLAKLRVNDPAAFFAIWPALGISGLPCNSHFFGVSKFTLN